MFAKSKSILAMAAVSAVLSAPVNAHAGLFGDFFNKVVGNVVESVASTIEWIELNTPNYLLWKTVTVPGGVCGDGSPYRFFINQSPFAKNTVVFYEPGGACWDYESCTGGARYSATNPNGIPRNYMYSLTFGAALGSVGAPMINRVGLHSPSPTRGLDWNYVYMPYCSGDVHTGNNVKVYKKDPTNPNSVARTQYFKGFVNSQEASKWLAAQKNHLILGPVAKPEFLLLTGQSAGGFGSPFNYSWFRSRLNPAKAGLLSDAGWLPNLPSPRTSDSPFRGVAIRALDEWKVTGPSGLITRYETDFGRRLPDRENLGDMVLGLSAQWPNDRFIFAQNMADEVLAGFADSAVNGKPILSREQLVLNMEKLVRDAIPRMDTLPNVGYYAPFGRDLNVAHCLTIVSFEGTQVIPQYGQRYDSVNAAILSALGRTPEPIRALDSTRVIQKTLPGMLEAALGGTH